MKLRKKLCCDSMVTEVYIDGPYITVGTTYYEDMFALAHAFETLEEWMEASFAKTNHPTALPQDQTFFRMVYQDSKEHEPDYDKLHPKESWPIPLNLIFGTGIGMHAHFICEDGLGRPKAINQKILRKFIALIEHYQEKLPLREQHKAEYDKMRKGWLTLNPDKNYLPANSERQIVSQTKAISPKKTEASSMAAITATCMAMVFGAYCLHRKCRKPRSSAPQEEASMGISEAK